MWLLERSVLARIEKLEESNIVLDAQQINDYTSTFYDAEGGVVNRVMSIKGDVATINVNGVLTNKPSFMSFLFGGGNTTYEELIQAFQIADSDSNVRQIDLMIDSPGGSVSGMFAVFEEMEKVSKPIIAYSGTQIASAAYGIAAHANEIKATNKGASFGSIGVAASVYVDENEIDLTSTNAPLKRPDVKTEEGRKAIVAQLDKVEEKFIEAIAKGRGVSVDAVISKFGQGSMMLAEEAKVMGLIDCSSCDFNKIEKEKYINTSSAIEGGNSMTLEELKTQHKSLYEQAVKLGVDKGVAQERDRVNSHLTLGQGCGDIDIAVAAIKNGEAMTSSKHAEYTAAMWKKNQVQDRIDDENPEPGGSDASAGDADSSVTQQEKDFGAELDKLIGGESE